MLGNRTNICLIASVLDHALAQDPAGAKDLEFHESGKEAGAALESKERKARARPDRGGVLRSQPLLSDHDHQSSIRVD